MRSTRVVLALLAVVCGAVVPAWAANDPGAAQQWGMQLVGAEAAWAVGTGHNVVIAVVDTGVDPNHEDLRGRVLPGRNFVTPGAPPHDDNGHGTHVAGIAAATGNNRLGVVGVAPDARILPVKVLASDGTGQALDLDDVPAGIRWAADNGAAVINVSLGIGVDVEGQYISANGAALRDAVQYAWNKGAIVVVSAGNDENATEVLAASRAIVVTATDRADRKASYATPVGDADWGMAAPGGHGTDPPRSDDNILSTWWVAGATNKYAYAAGTSMAAPHVAGAAAILRERGLSNEQAVDRLLTTAKGIGDERTFGAGRLDVARAVAGLPVSPNRPSAAAGTTPTTTRAPAGRRTTTSTVGGVGAGTGSPVGPGGPGAAPGLDIDSVAGANGGSSLDDDIVGGDEATGNRSGGGGDSGADDEGGRPWGVAAGALVLLAAATGAIVRARRA